MTRLLALPSLLMVLTLPALAEPPPPPKGDREGNKPHSPPRSGDHHERDRGGEWRGGGGFPGFGRPPMRGGDGFDKLPDADKKRVRDAFDKVWSRPEVIEARDKSMRANEEMREVIRAALGKIDPEAVAILARVEPKDNYDPRDLPKLPPADSPDFPRIIVQRMGMEMLAFSRPERREETRKLHERVIAQPQIQEAIQKLETTRGEERIQSMQKLREVYRGAIGKEFQILREKRANAEGKGEEGKGPK